MLRAELREEEEEEELTVVIHVTFDFGVSNITTQTLILP